MALATRFSTAVDRIEFRWVEAVVAVTKEGETTPASVADPTLDSEIPILLGEDHRGPILDAGSLRARIDWGFTILGDRDQLADWLVRGLIEEKPPQGSYVAAPALLAGLRDSVPVWHDLHLSIMLEEEPFHI